MRLVRLPSGTTAADVRALPASPRAVEDEVRAIVAEVRAGGDGAVRALTERFDRAEVGPGEIRVPAADVEAAIGALDRDVLDALQLTRDNVTAVARAQMSDGSGTTLPAGQVIEVLEVPVRRVGAYIPAGRAPYISTVVMCAATARAAGVGEIAVCAPPGLEGRAHPAILAACALCGVTEVYRMGGAQAIAALAYGTESVAAVDVVVGPGNAYVQEAKRQVFGRVGIDGVAGPSELVVIASADADAELVALDLLAQAEHGADSLVAVVSRASHLLDRVEAAARDLAERRATVADLPLALVEAADTAAALRLADEIAPEHLQLVGADVEQLSDGVRNAGCLFVGAAAGTAFGDYVAGSNHVLPTGGAARFAGGLSVATFRRRMARVSFDAGSASRLAPAGAAVARAEGFPVHAESMERRA